MQVQYPTPFQMSLDDCVDNRIILLAAGHLNGSVGCTACILSPLFIEVGLGSVGICLQVHIQILNLKSAPAVQYSLRNLLGKMQAVGENGL